MFRIIPLSVHRSGRRQPDEHISAYAAGMAQECQYDDFTVRIIRSARRQRTVSARLINWRLVEVRAPMVLPQSELDDIIKHLIENMKHKQGRQRRLVTDQELQRRAEQLNQRYFGGKLRWNTITYVDNQKKRYGSCTPQLGSIRISSRLKQVPDWVLDYVIIHELAHLIEPGHNASFWRLVNRYTLAERARGYLMALQYMEDEADDR